MPKFNRQRRNREQDFDSSGGNWLQTYADTITLLLAFFVLLYSMSTIDAEKFDRVLVSLHESFSGVLSEHQAQIPKEDPDITLPSPDRNIPEKEERMMENIYDQLKEYIDEADLADVVLLDKEEHGVVLRFQDKVLFDPGSANLKREGVDILNEIASILKEVPNEIKVEGFTDDVPQNTPEFPSNWELSTGRATTVLRNLTETGELDPERLSATGYGEYRPMVPNDSPENRQLNRRVDITVLWSIWEKGEFYDRDTTEMIDEGEDDIEL
ncbi:flagellar motor protein MotB [Natranaerobius trueperi]|uniref:OmpA-like domain-containing protein n=1 Tax=Natranaerobius trueperi TaxID=759412 RepID=A0A226BZ14_9FIRM|nr:OmpA family protein [Natranaerobius trueperi]OWZ84236.1 hypothetical protein CDO51_04045 [Natranaerobius trueperi]